MSLAIANFVAVLTPLLAFVAGIYFQRWMRDRVRARRVQELKWGRQ